MDILKIFKMQEPISRDMLTRNKTKEKSVEKEPNPEQIKALEDQVKELQIRNKQLEIRLTKLNAFDRVMTDYDTFIAQTLDRSDYLSQENGVLKAHIEKLEFTIKDIYDRFLRARQVVFGLKNNEELLKKELSRYETLLEEMQTKYGQLKNHSETKLKKCNDEIILEQNKHIKEIADLKGRILEGQARINQLESHVKMEDVPKTSIFLPLKSNILSKM